MRKPMFQNYLRSTIRVIRQASIYGLLNIVGLAMGIAFAGLIFLWVEEETQYDHAVPKHNQLYSIRFNVLYGGSLESNNCVPGPMVKAIRGTVPGLIDNCRLGNARELFGLKDNSAYAEGIYVDSSFFAMLQPPFEQGSPKGFAHPHSIILTDRMAQKFFSATSPLGKTLKLNKTQEFVVIGVIANPPQNSTIQYDWLAPISNYLEHNRWLEPWVNYGIQTLVELNPGTDVNRVNQALTAIIQPKDHRYATANCRLYAMNDWHLLNDFQNGEQTGRGFIHVVRLIAIIAWITLIMGCINFMNLSTARASRRALEIGIRKTLGAQKPGLITQFLFETLIMALLATLLAVLLIYTLLPPFTRLLEKQLDFEPFKPAHLLSLLAIATICGLVAGSYPAFYLSAFQPVAVLRGQRVNPGGGAGFIRRGLVVLQFTIAIILIVDTVITYQQIQYLRARDIGFNRQALLYTELTGNLHGHYSTLKTELLQTGVVDNVALSDSPPLSIWHGFSSSDVGWEGSDPTAEIKINRQQASPEYLTTMGMRLKAGRDFDPDARADSGDVIINESLAALMGKSGRPDAVITNKNGVRSRVIGIVRNFVFNNVIQSVEPLIITCAPEEKSNFNYLNIRLKAGPDLATRIAKIKAVIKANNPGYPVDYLFTDDQFNQLFKLEDQCGVLAGIFASLAVVISCLGLLGLAAYTAERRMREMGIRKVLGASATSLAALLSSEFVKLVGLSCLIATPLGWWLMVISFAWYSDRVPIHWWVFADAGGAALVVALLTVSSQAIKAALKNPVETLRAE